MSATYTLCDSDFQVVEEYSGFLPTKVFDAHTHIYLREATPLEKILHPGYTTFVLKKCTYEDYCSDMAVMLPGVQRIRLNMMPMPDPVLNDRSNGLLERVHSHVIQQQQTHPDCVASVYILPDDSSQTIFDLASVPGVRGLKPYFYSTGRWEGQQFNIPDFLPDSAWEVSSALGIPIILHLKKQSLADSGNFSYIERMMRRYPDAKLVLAHCARATTWEQIYSIERLIDNGRIWFDLSSVVNPGQMIPCILKTAGQRVVWGSDYPVSMYRSASVAGHPSAFDGIFGLRAFFRTAQQLCLSHSMIEDIFYYNACTLFDVDA